MIGTSKTMEFVMTGRGIRGGEALAIGLANKIVESGTGKYNLFIKLLILG